MENEYDKKLSNGISYEFRECDMDMCYVSLIVWNGSLKDRGRYGIAHFLEHMLMQMDYEGYGVGDDFHVWAPHLLNIQNM